MAEERQTPGASGQQSGQAGRKASKIDLDQLTQELAQELGVDPANLQDHGPAAQQARAYEAQTHGRRQHQPENR